MGKFFNGRVKNNRETLVKYGIIIGGAILIIILLMLIVNANNKKNKPVFELKQAVDVEINSNYPEPIDYFSKFDKYDINDITVNTDYADITKVGNYTVTLTAKNGAQGEVILNVVDTTAPVLVTKEVVLETAASYSPEDFVLSCEDNSKDVCIIEFYKSSQDQNGNIIDYSTFTDQGTHTVKLVAKDNEGNITEATDATLVIGNANVQKPVVECNYGDLSIPDYVKYPIALIVGDEENNCALNRDLWDSETTQNLVNELYNTDYKKLQSEISPLIEKEFPNGANIVVYPNYVSVLNKEAKGLIGYAIYVKVYVADATKDEKVDVAKNLKLEYYINPDKTRQYKVNTYKLP